MEYIPLSKVYYKAPKEYEAEAQRRVNSPFAHPVRFMVGQYPLFFLQLPKLYQTIIELYRIDREIGYLVQRLPPVAITNFELDSLIGEIVITNEFEGVSSSRREVRESLENLHQGEKRRFDGIVSKYQMLLSQKEIPLETPEDIRRLYDELLLEGKSEIETENLPDGRLFRKGSVSVTDAFDREIHRGLYPEERIIEALDMALSILRDEGIDPVLSAGLFHYLFGYIHPFYDGNGRISRFISSYLLARTFSPILAYRLSYPIFQNRRAYEEAFKVCNNPRSRGDATPFLLMFTGIILQAMQGLYEALVQRAARLDFYVQGLRQAARQLPGWDENFLKCLFILIQATLFSEEGIGRQALAEACGYSLSTLNKQLIKLRDLQLLLTERSGRENRYQLSLEQLDEVLEQFSNPS